VQAKVARSDYLLHDERMNKSKALLQRFLPLVCAALLFAAAFFPYQMKKGRLRIVPGVWPPAEALLLAGDMQILPLSRFQIIEIPWSSAVMRAFGSGAADVAVVTLDNVLSMRAAGQKLRVLMVLSQSVGADAIVAPPAVQLMQGLKGKRVGIELSAGSYLLANALESAGMSMPQIELIPMFQSEMEQALQSSQVEAVVVTEPWLTNLSRDGMHSIYDSSKLKVPILYLLVASERACLSSRADLVSLLKAQAEMAEMIWAGKPFPGIDAVLRREKMSPVELATCLRQLHSLNKNENQTMLKQLPELSRQMEDQMVRNGIITTRPSNAQWIDASILMEAFR
jgi:NitT/TauT family transport system substrate-binding protein